MFARINMDKAAEALGTIGIATKDVSGELRSASQIYSEVATKWDTLSRAQKTYVAEAMAGEIFLILASYDMKISYKNSVNCWKLLRAS